MSHLRWPATPVRLGWIGLAALLSAGVAAAETPASFVEIAAAPEPIASPSAAPIAPAQDRVSVEPTVDAAAPAVQLSEAPAEGSVAPAPKRARCVRVIDGDTLVLDGDERVRVLYINTPEKKEEMGPEAGQFTRDLVLFKEVDLVYSADSERDHYGRLLAEVYVDGVSLEESLLSEGMAHLFLLAPERPPANIDRLIAAQARARQEGKGVWATERYRSTLHITSFHANARGHDGENLNGEYLRIANVTGQPLNVGGYTLSSAHGKVLTLPDFTIPAGYSFQILSGEGVTNDDPSAGPLQIYWGSTFPIWINDGDAATLRDTSGHPVDKVVHAPKRH